jgi:Protein of unknown function (DUF1553)/Protein of unknown function (DUF1549)/Concanavalin A-like lectin/glucanases superfamily/Planctomycete cytochrome C
MVGPFNPPFVPLTRVFLFSVVVALPPASAAETAMLNYDRDVRPILSENCFPCHGQDSKKRMAGLRLDSFEGATADRGGGRVALSPGKPGSSEIYKRITNPDKSRRMPPAFSNRTLTPSQVAILKRWIEDGGRYAPHWSFVPPIRPAIPDTNNPEWIKQPIDAFVLKRLDAEGLKPSPPAAPEMWLRRVTLDLTGLPPSIDELDSFAKEVKAHGEAGYELAVDRLLASPAYGERMAMDWMDVARYSDTHGFNNDAERSMWRWRDWVITAFNSNMPYNRFITEQLAGDLLPRPTLDQRIATGFGRNGVINSEGGIIDEEYRVEYVTDRVRTLGMAWLGLTLECAHCHDHKFDPITQRDHYRFFAFFNNVPEMGEDGRVANAAPFISAPTAEQQARMRILETAIDQLSKKVERSEKKASVAQLEASHLDLRQTPVAHRGPASQPVLHIPCESANEFANSPQTLSLDERGVAGRACAALAQSGLEAPPATDSTGPKKRGIPVAKRNPLTFTLWVNPSSADTDVALLSGIDYSQPPAATSYGHGIEVHLAGGEIEFRFSDRFPAYSIRVQSEGAHLTAGQWQHVTVVYSGPDGRDDGRARASWVRMFADGRELPTVALNDDLGLPEAKTDKPKPTVFRIGWDNRPKSPRLAGRLDEIAVWNRALTPDEIAGLFESQALPYAIARQKERTASAVETGWLREAELRAQKPAIAKELAEIERLRFELFAIRRDAPTVMVMEEMATPRETRILMRGVYNQPGEKVEPGVPEQLLGAWPEWAPKNRLGLAEWLTKPDHPVTSRVVVNRFWQQLFGEGLVKTSDNFGMQGEWPSNPELLDWLAREFVDSGWNVKALMRRLVLSATYRQDSSASPELIARDPENRLLARGPRFRMPAEFIRDQALEISGLLKPRIGGPSVYPYQTAGIYKGIVVAANYPGTSWPESKGDDLYRRSLYTFWKRTVPHPTMNVFDVPDREVCVIQRSITNTPLQALTLLNDPIFVEAARKLAERSVREGGATPESRLAFAFRLATGRKPDSAEIGILSSAFNKMLAAYQHNESGAHSLLSVGTSAGDDSIPAGELAAYTAVMNIILNLDETITKG